MTLWSDSEDWQKYLFHRWSDDVYDSICQQGLVKDVNNVQNKRKMALTTEIDLSSLEGTLPILMNEPETFLRDNGVILLSIKRLSPLDYFDDPFSQPTWNNIMRTC